MLYRLREQGLRVRVFEAGPDVGGTWYWNCYPGARCDVESVEYSYSFDEAIQQEWNWSERYATQPEILQYLQFVAHRLKLRPDIQFNTRVTRMRFSPSAGHWTVHTDKGDEVRAKFCVMATGCLSTPKLPEVDGVQSFQGKWYHTSSWPKEPVQFTGQRVAVIGTGSTGMQLIPEIARDADRLYVLQRTANYAIPARSGPLDPQEVKELKRNYPAFRQRARECPSGVNHFMIPTRSAQSASAEEREAAFEDRWRVGGAGLTRAFNDILLNEDSNRMAGDFVRGKIRAVVKDPRTAQLLSPTYLIGTKRLGTETGYFETFNRDNVELIDLRSEPIKSITPSGIRVGEREVAVDAIVFATGFDAITGALLAIDIGVDGGPELRKLWSEGPRSYLGVMVAGIPNFFTITGPGSPSVISNVVVSIEQHVGFISDLLQYTLAQGCRRVEADQAMQDAWVQHVNEVANGTLLPRGQSWYVGANVPGKPRVFMPYVGGVGNYRLKCLQIAAEGYTGFVFAN